MTFEYVCFSISNMCNLKCPYCFRIQSKNDYINDTDFKICIEKLIKLGCTIINLSGGEALLNPNWKTYVKICKDYGIKTILSSNGTSLNLYDETLRDLDVLSIPLDGYTESINSKTRGIGHYNKIMGLIENYVRDSFSFKLKINTVVTKYNFYSLENIGQIINYKNIVWKLFQYRTKGFYNHLNKELVVCNADIRLKLKKIMESNLNCWVMEEDILNDLSKPINYININCDGDVLLSDNMQDVHLGSLLNDSIEFIYENFRKLKPKKIPYKSLMGD